MTPEEQEAYVAQLEADKNKLEAEKAKIAEKASALEADKKSLEDEKASMAAKLKDANVDMLDTSFEAEVEDEDGNPVKKRFDFVGKLVHVFGETVDVRQLVRDGDDASMKKFDKICVELVKIKSGLLKEI